MPTLRGYESEGIRKVTPEDVQHAAQKYLVADKRTVGILIPVKNRGQGSGARGQGTADGRH
jgi:hypothetical protein